MEQKLYVINTAKKIHCLNHITGPITTPTLMNPVDVLGLVKTGFEVYEVNPYNRRERVRVTPYNFNSITFKTSQSDMIKRRKLNREMQDISKKESVKNDNKKNIVPTFEEIIKDEIKKDEIKFEKKEDKKESDKKAETEKVETQKPKHTDFEKH